MATTANLNYGWADFTVKYNPNHDSRGRFSSGGAGAGGRGRAGATTSGAGQGASSGAGGTTAGQDYNNQGQQVIPVQQNSKVQLVNEGRPNTGRLDSAHNSHELSRANKITEAIEASWPSSEARWIALAAVIEKTSHLAAVGNNNPSRHLRLVTAVAEGENIRLASNVMGIISISSRYSTMGTAAKDNRIYVDYLATHPSAKGKGVGTALIREAAREGVRLGYGGLKLTALDTAISYYRDHLRMKQTVGTHDFSWSKAQMTTFAKSGIVPRTAVGGSAPRARGSAADRARAAFMARVKRSEAAMEQERKARTAKVRKGKKGIERAKAAMEVSDDIHKDVASSLPKRSLNAANTMYQLSRMTMAQRQQIFQRHGVWTVDYNEVARHMGFATHQGIPHTKDYEFDPSKALSGISSGAIVGAGNKETYLSTYDEIVAAEPENGAFASKRPVFSEHPKSPRKSVHLLYGDPQDDPQDDPWADEEPDAGAYDESGVRHVSEAGTMVH